MYYIVYGDQLAHHGIKGQKKGLRRYQNPDGSLTPAGRIRYGVGKKRSSSKSDSSVSTDTLKNVQSVIKSGKELQKAGKAIVNESMKKTAQKNEPRGSKFDVDLSTISDKDLQRVVNRMNLERQYKQLKPKQINKGQKMVDDILNYGGSALSIAGGAVSLALAIKKLKEG